MQWHLHKVALHPLFQIKLEFRSVNFCGGRKTRKSEEKPSEQDKNQQQIQPTHDAGSDNRIRDTLVGGKHSHHCAIPPPLLLLMSSTKVTWVANSKIRVCKSLVGC